MTNVYFFHVPVACRRYGCTLAMNFWCRCGVKMADSKLSEQKEGSLLVSVTSLLS